MRDFRSVLLVFDKEDDATAALEWVVPLTRGSQTRLTVVEVVDQVPCGVRTSTRMTDPQVHRGSQQPGVECGEKHLAQSMEILRAQGLDPDSRVLVGIPFVEITRQVLRDGHDLVIVPAEGNCGLRKQLLDSPALHLMRTCPCPIWMFRSARGRPHGGILAALEGEEEDNEGLNHKILDFAYCLAQWKNREIHVLHARPTGEERFPRQPAGAGQSTCQELSLESSARDRNRLDSRHARYGFVNRTMHFYYLGGAPVSLICRLAHDRQIDLIVMGTAHRPGATECVLGNTAETVVHQVGCSVLSVKPDSFVSPVTA
jgi:nucleotide-binding universal stress UspA family protein